MLAHPREVGPLEDDPGEEGQVAGAEHRVVEGLGGHGLAREALVEAKPRKGGGAARTEGASEHQAP